MSNRTIMFAAMGLAIIGLLVASTQADAAKCGQGKSGKACQPTLAYDVQPNGVIGNGHLNQTVSGEMFTASSSLVGKNVVQITAYWVRFGTVTGPLHVAAFNGTTGALIQDFGSIDTSLYPNNVANSATINIPSGYIIKPGVIIGTTWNGAGDLVNIIDDWISTNNPVDGTNSYYASCESGICQPMPIGTTTNPYDYVMQLYTNP